MFLLVFILTETCPLVTNLTGTDPVSGLDKMVSTGDPQLRGPHDQWLVLITPSDVSLGVHPHRDLPSCHQPKGYRPVSTRWSPPVILICVVLMITVAR